MLGADPAAPADIGQFLVQVLLATGCAGIISAIANAFLSRRKTAADVSKTEADTEATRVSAASVLSGSAVQLLERMDRDVTKLSKRVTDLETANAGLQQAVEEGQQRERGHVRMLSAYRQWIEVATRLLAERGIPIDPPPQDDTTPFPALPPAD